MFELSTVPKITGEQLLNQAAASLLWNIKWLTSHGGQTGGFGYTMGDVSYVAMIAMLASQVQDEKLRATLNAGVSEFLTRLPTPVSLNSSCVALLQTISTLSIHGTPLTPGNKTAFVTELGQCKQEGSISDGQALSG